MRPTLLLWRDVRVHSYGVMLYLGLVAGAYAAAASADSLGLHGDAVAAAILALLLPAVLGARLTYVVGHWSVYRRQPKRILGRNQGGAVAYGALLAVPVSVPLLLWLDVPLRSFWDAGAIGFLAATVFLRIGCLLNGCCSGRATSSRFGIELRSLAGERTRRIPTQLIEAGLAAALLTGGAFVLGHTPFPGALFITLLGAYALGRFMLEFTREQPRRLGRLTVAQALSAAFVALCLAVFAIAFLDQEVSAL